MVGAASNLVILLMRLGQNKHNLLKVVFDPVPSLPFLLFSISQFVT